MERHKSSGHIDVSVVLPTYNERGNVAPLIREISRQMKGYRTEFIVVDDNSQDGTAEEVRKIRGGSVRLIVRKGERGLASAVWKGISSSKGAVVVLMDVDFSHPPGLVPVLVGKTKSHDMAFASRYVRGGRMEGTRMQYFLSKLLNRFIKTVLGIPVLDSTGGFFAARRNVFDGIKPEHIFDGYGDYCFKFLFSVRKTGYKTIELPFAYQPRKSGNSKTRVFSAGFSYVFRALKLRLGFR